MPRKNKHTQSTTRSDVRDQTSHGNGIWMLIISIFVLACLVAGLFTLQASQFNRPIPANETVTQVEEIPNPDEWLIPLPDAEGMEPQVAQLIKQTHDALATNRASAQAWGQYAKVLDAHQLYNPAVQCYENAKRLDPENIRWKYLHTIALEFQGKDIQRIVDQFKDIARATELYPPVHLRLGNALMKQGKTLEARDAYKYSVELDDTFAMGHRGLGQALLSLNDIAGAIQHLNRAAQLSPHDNIIFASLAQAYARSGQKEKATQAADRAKELQPDHSIPDTLRHEVDLLAIDSASCAFRAQRYVSAREYEKAIKEYQIVERVFPDDANVHIKMARIYRLLNQNDSAYDHLIKATDLQENNTTARVLLADYYAKDRKFKPAIEQYQKAIAIDPNQILWRTGLATAFARSGDHKQAIVEFQKTSTLGKLSAQAYSDWGTTYALDGNLESAIEQYKLAVEQNPDFVEALFHLGLAYEQIGQSDQAIDAYKRAVKIDPHHYAAEKLAELQ